MNNPYKAYLDDFFSTLLEYRHSTDRLNRVLKKDIEIYSKEEAQFFSSSALVISDWSGPTDKGWEMNFHTGVFKNTLKNNYEQEIQNLISRECCLMYAQSFEALEKYVKDCLFDKAGRDEELKKYIISLRNKQPFKFERGSMPGGDNLYRILKKTGGKTFTKYSKENNLNVKFSELWTVLSEARHSITHSRSIIGISKLNRSNHHTEIFDFLFNCSLIDNDSLLIQLDYYKLDRLIKRLSEFAYQILKILSIEDGIQWEVYKRKASQNNS
jgi:hypothetical protein